MGSSGRLGSPFSLLRSRLAWVAALAGLMWLLALVNALLGYELLQFGLRPRTASGLVGILWGPFLHGGFGHLLVNTVPFLVLGGLVALRSSREFVETTLFVIIVGGAGVWVFGRPGPHIGASLLLFGYFGYLVAAAWYRRSLGAIISAVLVIGTYGTILWGILPTLGQTSWESHLSGLLAGLLRARLTHVSE